MAEHRSDVTLTPHADDEDASRRWEFQIDGVGKPLESLLVVSAVDDDKRMAMNDFDTSR